MFHCTRTKDEQEEDQERRYKPFPERPYIKPLLDVLEHEPVVFIEKSRTMMASWLVSAYIAHRCFTEQGIRALIQSEDEARALHDIDYIKVLWEQSDEALRARWKLRDGKSSPWAQAYNTVELDNRSLAIGLVGNPDKVRSEHPTIYMMDEAAIMVRGSYAYDQAIATRCKKIICLSSAFPGWFREHTRDAVPVDWPDYSAGETCSTANAPVSDKLTDEMRKMGWFQRKKTVHVRTPCPGLSMRRNKDGAAVVRLHYSADPTFTEETKEKLRKRAATPAVWRMEMEIEYEAMDGTLVFPEFSPELHVVPHNRIPAQLCRYMAIDPHPRTPHAFLWIGLDDSEIYVYRELWPSKMYGSSRMLRDSDEENSFTVREYAEVIADWEGNKFDLRHRGTEREYAAYIYNKGTGEYILDRWMDQAGKGFIASAEDEEQESYTERYKRYGIDVSDPYKIKEPGFEKVRELLRPRPHDLMGKPWPRLHISDRCTELIYEMSRLRYLKDKRQTEEKELKQGATPVRDHLVDLLRYLVTADLGYNRKWASPLSPNDAKYSASLESIAA